jgi:ArsR family transcriptional regulator, arsenate/arsenite/antimonite-responsive transcriptional repressor
MKKTEGFLRATGDDKRLRILKMLEKRHMCVCELTAVLGIRQPTVSRHLKRLEEAGLVRLEQNGFYTECYIVDTHAFRGVWRLLSAKLDDSAEIASDLRRMGEVDRRALCTRKAR